MERQTRKEEATMNSFQRVLAAEAPLCYGSYAEHGKGIDFYNTPEAVIEGARVGLLTFLTALEEKIQRIEVRWRYVTGCRRAAFNAMAHAWHHRAKDTSSV